MLTQNRTVIRSLAICGTTIGASLATGCSMPNSSTPTLSLRGAQLSQSSATLQLEVENPSDMDVRINSIDWSMVYGPLPVAEGSWRLDAPVPAHGSHLFSKRVPFTSPVLDSSADTLELTGSMDLETVGDKGDMSLREGSFNIKAPIEAGR